MPANRIILVGDNPFHGISHVAQKKAVLRGKNILIPANAAEVVLTAINSGADAFTFTVSDTTLAILKHLRYEKCSPPLYAIAPYAYEYIRLAVSLGGIPGLGKRVAIQIIKSRNLRAINYGIKAALTLDPAEAYKAYVAYEVSRIRAASGKRKNLKCLFLHQVVGDMALALDMEWLFRAHIAVLSDLDITPGFHTHNLPFFTHKMNAWHIDMSNILITAPFNAIGMQMNPCREDCEKALSEINRNNVIAFAVLAGGLLPLSEAINYINQLPGIMGVALGVSRKEQAENTFAYIRKNNL